MQACGPAKVVINSRAIIVRGRVGETVHVYIVCLARLRGDTSVRRSSGTQRVCSALIAPYTRAERTMLRTVATVSSLALAVGALSAAAELPAAAGEREGKFAAASTNMIASMARQLVTQSYANSQVLSLNLSNVLILLLLKAVLFSIGHFSASQGGKGFGGGWWGRSDPDTQPRGLPDSPDATSLSVTEGELMLALGYMKGERSNGDFGCLYRAACEDPSGRARQYLDAGRMVLKAANVVSSVLTVNPKYSKLADSYEEALTYGATRGDCAAKYLCKVES